MEKSDVCVYNKLESIWKDGNVCSDGPYDDTRLSGDLAFCCFCVVLVLTCVVNCRTITIEKIQINIKQDIRQVCIILLQAKERMTQKYEDQSCSYPW